MPRRRKALFDTNLFIDWLRARARPELFADGSLEHYLSAIVLMELHSGAVTPRSQRDVLRLASPYRAVARLVAPSLQVYERAGRALSLLRAGGHDVSRASFVHDLLIALSARDLGATVFTRDRDFAAIREVDDFALEIVR